MMDPVILRLIILILIFVAVMLAVEGMINWIHRNRSESRVINKRLEMIGRGVDRSDIRTQLRREVKNQDASLPALLNAIVRAVDRIAVGSNLKISALTLIAILGCATLGLFIFLVGLAYTIGWTLSVGGLFLIGVFSVALAVGLPLMVIAGQSEGRRKKLQEQFPVALDVFIRGLRAGHPVAAALELLTEEMPDPIGSEFGMVVDEMTYGADMREALQSMADRWSLEDMKMFVVSLSVQTETGGNLAEILENLSRVIRERQSMVLKVRALSSEGRMTAAMLTGLPIFTFVLLFMFNPSFYLGVADDPAFVPGFGGLLLLYMVGFVVIRRLINLKV